MNMLVWCIAAIFLSSKAHVLGNQVIENSNNYSPFRNDVAWIELVKDFCHLAEAIWHYLMEYYLGLGLCVVMYLLFSMLKEIADVKVKVAALNVSYKRERERLLRDEMSNEEDLVVRLDHDYNHCGVCHEPFATDMQSTVQETRKMLPVLGSCGHYFCHGCIFRLRTMVGLNGAVRCPKCMRANQFVRENQEQ